MGLKKKLHDHLPSSYGKPKRIYSEQVSASGFAQVVTEAYGAAGFIHTWKQVSLGWKIVQL